MFQSLFELLAGPADLPKKVSRVIRDGDIDINNRWEVRRVMPTPLKRLVTCLVPLLERLLASDGCGTERAGE